jgi:hypothetical protein
MSRLNHRAPRTRRTSHRPDREARTRRSFDGVVASYIRELSAAEQTPTLRHSAQQ